MMLFKESDVLNEDFRKKVLQEIKGAENQARKERQYIRYQIYHDQVARYTIDLLAKQFDLSTIEEMRVSLTNVSLCRKIIDKLARVYSYGVERVLKSKRDQKKFDEFLKDINATSKMKKANRYLELHNNIWITLLPKPNKDALGNVISYDLKLSIVPPFLFDVIEDYDDREKAKCLILSNFNPQDHIIRSDAPERNGTRSANSIGSNSYDHGDNKDQIIADTPMDYDPKCQKYTWWTDSFHFVTDERGAIIAAPDQLLNPIGEMPGVAINKDQDGEYYSVGGNDLVDSCLLANAMLTNINHIGIQQGYGQAYMIGKNLPQELRIGPTKIVKLEQAGDGDNPSFGFASSNPPLAELKELAVTQIALLLSTNNLSTSGVKVNLSNGADFPSGIAMMIDKAESTEDVQDQAQIFIDTEPELWEIAIKWLSLYRDKGLLSEDLADMSFDLEGMLVKINDPTPIQSEGDKLDNLKKRKDLGINSMLDLIKLDHPEYTEEEAQAKLLSIQDEKMASFNNAIAAAQANSQPVQPDQNSADQMNGQDQSQTDMLNGNGAMLNA